MPELVNEFIRVAHGDFARVQALLEQEPQLIHAAWDWGGGDWETALGSAAHVGRRDIALFLLDHGARIDIFAATMLGELTLVQAMLNSYPAMLYQAGPHGIPLLQHARAGGEPARTVLAFLESRLAESTTDSGKQ